MNFLLKKKERAKSSPPGADHGRKMKAAGLLDQRLQRKFKMVDEDSHSTDLSVSVEEGHSTILLAHYTL